jgi:hypothetical protein
MKCIYIDNYKKCETKTEYGNYCKKHKRNHLFDENENIIINRFTFSEKDYLKKDLLKFYKENIHKKSSNLNKSIIYSEVKNHIQNNLFYNTNIKSIIKIQSLVRKNNIIAFDYINCNNREDFYSYELLIHIPKKYFYSYKDTSNIQWGFDIRSFKKLIDLNFPNPYTTEIIPENIKNDVMEKYNKLKLENNYEDNIEIIQRDRREMIKQKAVDLFSLIEQHGYSCNIEWILNLSLRRLKELYRQLEDLWNYRLNLTIEYKRIISPPTGALFTTPVIEVLNYTNKEDIQELILNEISKMNHCESDSDRKVGYLYFIIGLGQVSQNCWITHQEILSVM